MNFVFASPQAEKLLGFAPEHWTSHPSFWMDRVQRFRSRLGCAVLSARHRNRRGAFVRVPGHHRRRERRLAAGICPCASRVREGQPRYMIGVAVDVTRAPHAGRSAGAIRACGSGVAPGQPHGARPEQHADDPHRVQRGVAHQPARGQHAACRRAGDPGRHGPHERAHQPVAVVRATAGRRSHRDGSRIHAGKIRSSLERAARNARGPRLAYVCANPTGSAPTSRSWNK